MTNGKKKISKKKRVSKRVGKKKVAAKKPASKPTSRGVGNRKWLSPTEFLEFIKETEDISLSRKNLYKTYLGKDATHPLERNRDGKIHRERAIEIIKMVGKRENVPESDDISRRRQLADMRIKTARAGREELKFEAEAKNLIPVSLVIKLAGRAMQEIKREGKSLSYSLADALEGKDVKERVDVIADAWNLSFKKLSAAFESLAH